MTWDAVAGTTYYIEWDDNAGAAEIEGHDLVLEDATAPSVDVTFRVNMEREASISAGGVRINGSFTNGDLVMTNMGNDIWETTVELGVGETVTYKFKNGPNVSENNDDLAACGVADGSGAFSRELTTGDVDETLTTVCFNWCVTCDLVGANETAFAKAIGVNPNPAGDYVNVSYKFESTTNLNVRLVNSFGQVILERNLDNAINGNERLSVSNLPSGAYSVVFNNGQEAIAKRLIVE